MTKRTELAAEAINRRWKHGGNDADLSKGMIPIGRTIAVPKRVTSRFESRGRAPNVTIDVEVDDAKHWRCVRLEATGHDLMNASIHDVRIKDLMAAALAQVALTRQGDSNNFHLREHSTLAVFADVSRRYRRKRATVDLQRVADVYRAAVDARDPAPVGRVVDEFHCARSTAGRYVSEARELGLLPPTTRGKAQA